MDSLTVCLGSPNGRAKHVQKPRGFYRPQGFLDKLNRTASIEAVRRDCRKSGFAAFSRKLRCVLRLGCPLIADNSTLTPRKVFSATHMSRQKTYHTAFASADAKLCEAFFDKLDAARMLCIRAAWCFYGRRIPPVRLAPSHLPLQGRQGVRPAFCTGAWLVDGSGLAVRV